MAKTHELMTENGISHRRNMEDEISFRVTLRYLSIDPNLDYEGEGPAENLDGLSEVERRIASRFGEAMYTHPPKLGVRRMEWLTDGDLRGLTAEEIPEFIRIIESEIPHFTISIQRDGADIF